MALDPHSIGVWSFFIPGRSSDFIWLASLSESLHSGNSLHLIFGVSPRFFSIPLVAELWARTKVHIS